MTRFVALALASLSAAPAAHAGSGAVYIDHATPSLGLSVDNVSGSSDVDERLFQVTSTNPVVHVDGDFGCPVGSTADSLQLAVGAVQQLNTFQDLITLGVWDYSEPFDLGGQPFGSFSIDHELDIQNAWDPQVDIVTFGFNAAHTVNHHYYLADMADADMVHWMQSDQVFEDGFTMNVILWCDDGQELYPSLDAVWVDVSVLYHGDRGIQYQTAVGTPGDVDSGTTGTPGYDSTGTGGSDPSTGDGGGTRSTDDGTTVTTEPTTIRR